MGKKEQIALRIKTMRKSRHMTQEDLAKAIGQSSSSITMYEKGRREPDFQTLEALADVFNVSFDSLVSESEFVSDDSETKPQTKEARIICSGIDKLSKEERERALAMLRFMFQPQYADLFVPEGNDENDS